jgi:hypothetical protein
VFLIASGDLRLSANQTCWPAQAGMERQIIAAFAADGITLKRVHPYDETLQHGLIWNQRMGMDVKSIPPQAPLIVEEDSNLRPSDSQSLGIVIVHICQEVTNLRQCS